MQTKVVEFRTDKRFDRRVRELETIETMIRMHCQHRHWNVGLCPDCAELNDYAKRRLERCVFGDEKPTCAHCLVHCYNDEMRQRIRATMRWAGPRMLVKHPYLAVMHMVDGRRPTPKLPEKAPKA